MGREASQDPVNALILQLVEHFRTVGALQPIMHAGGLDGMLGVLPAFLPGSGDEGNAAAAAAMVNEQSNTLIEQAPLAAEVLEDGDEFGDDDFDDEGFEADGFVDSDDFDDDAAPDDDEIDDDDEEEEYWDTDDVDLCADDEEDDEDEDDEDEDDEDDEEEDESADAHPPSPAMDSHMLALRILMMAQAMSEASARKRAATAAAEDKGEAAATETSTAEASAASVPAEALNGPTAQNATPPAPLMSPPLNPPNVAGSTAPDPTHDPAPDTETAAKADAPAADSDGQEDAVASMFRVLDAFLATVPKPPQIDARTVELMAKIATPVTDSDLKEPPTREALRRRQQEARMRSMPAEPEVHIQPMQIFEGMVRVHNLLKKPTPKGAIARATMKVADFMRRQDFIGVHMAVLELRALADALRDVAEHVDDMTSEQREAVGRDLPIPIFTKVESVVA